MPTRVYLEIAPLDPALHPCHVTRVLGVTMVSVSEDAKRSAVALFFADHLTIAEQDAIRLGYGVPPCGQRFDDRWLEGCVSPVVPDGLVLPWQRARRAA